jgi:hypothetical protein
MIGPALIEHFDSLEVSNLLARKTYLLELPNVCHSEELLSEFHGHPPVSPSGHGGSAVKTQLLVNLLAKA